MTSGTHAVSMLSLLARVMIPCQSRTRYKDDTLLDASAFALLTESLDEGEGKGRRARTRAANVGS